MEELQRQINILRQDLAKLNSEFYNGNFSSQQDFTKYSNFTTRLKIPVYTDKPTKCDIGEIVALTSGTYYACKATNTWTKFI
jgi:hypothetical protein